MYHELDEKVFPASLAARGVKVKQLDLFGSARELVQLAQKKVKHAPSDKFYDTFIAMSAGALGVVEINTRLRSDRTLQAAFGREQCAEQSIMQETLDACTAENVAQLEQNLDTIYRQHCQGYRHDYAGDFQLLDVDMSSIPCGKKATLSTKGYFAKQRNRRGRQLGRVLATHFAEVVTNRLFEGKTQTTKTLQPLIQAAEATLELDETKRQRPIVRVDAGGDSLDDVNWLLARGYYVHCKDYVGHHARVLAQSVDTWIEDLHVPRRQVRWVTHAPTAYVLPVKRLVVRCRQQSCQWVMGVLISTLSAAQMLQVTGQPLSQLDNPTAVRLSYVSFYDQCEGGIETTFKGGKQGLGLTMRNKKRFAARQHQRLLGCLAHNVVIWGQSWLAPSAMCLQHYGILRLVRDVFHISSFLVLDALGRFSRLSSIWLPLSITGGRFFAGASGSVSIVICLGET